MRVAVDPLASSDDATRAVLSRTSARSTRRHVAGAARLDDASRTELVGLLDAVRQAGREVLVRGPRFLVLDLRVRICVERAFVAEVVERAVYQALLEHALGGPDTTTRVRRLRRVRFAELPMEGELSCSAFPEVVGEVLGGAFDPATHEVRSDVRLRLEPVDGEASADPCAPPRFARCSKRRSGRPTRSTCCPLEAAS